MKINNNIALFVSFNLSKILERDFQLVDLAQHLFTIESSKIKTGGLFLANINMCSLKCIGEILLMN